MLAKSTFISQYGVQICAGFAATIYMSSASLAFGWTSPLLAKMQSHPLNARDAADADDVVHISTTEGAWFVMLYHIGLFSSPLPTAWLMNVYGRKTAMLVGIVPLTLSYLTIAHTRHFGIWCATRFAAGLTYGSAYTVLPVYVGEIAAPAVRGALTFIFVLMIKVGLVLGYLLGAQLGRQTLAYVGLGPLLAFVVAVRWLPESPYYLVAAGRADRARACVRRLRGGGGLADAGDAEMRAIEATVSGAMGLGAALRRLFRDRGARLSLMLMLHYGNVVAFSGSQTLLAYAQVLFESYAGAAGETVVLSASNATVLVGVVQIPALMFASLAIDRFGRRPLLLLSIAGTSLCNCVCAAALWAEHHETTAALVSTAQLQWLMIGAMMVYFVFYVVGMCAVFSVFIGELFGTAVRSTASALIITAVAATSMAVSKLFQVVSDGCGVEWTFVAFAACGGVYFVYMWRVLPETKGKSLEEIEAMMAAEAEVTAPTADGAVCC